MARRCLSWTLFSAGSARIVWWAGPSGVEGNGVQPNDEAGACFPHPWAVPNRYSSPGNGPAFASRTGAAEPLSGPSWGSRSRGGSSLGCRKASLWGRGKKPEWVTWPRIGGGLRWGLASGSAWLGPASSFCFCVILPAHPGCTPTQTSYNHRFQHISSSDRVFHH